MISDIWNFISKFSYWNVLFNAFGIISFILAVVSYIRSKRTQRPKFIMNTARLNSSIFQNTNIEVKQGDRVLTDLSVSIIVIWNSGITIKKSDIATKSPLRVSAPENAEILDFHAIYSDEVNDIKCTLSDNHKKVTIEFDFLAKGDGLILKIFHTCAPSDKLDVQCSLTNGTNIAYLEGIIASVAKRISYNFSNRAIRLFLGSSIMLLCFVEIFVLIFFGDKQAYVLNSPLLKYIQIAIYFLLLVYTHRLFFHRRLPKKLDDALKKERLI